MLNPKKLVLVVGAGASKEANLPVGNELKHQIATRLNFEFTNSAKTRGDALIFKAIRSLSNQVGTPFGNIDELVNGSKLISNGMTQAISIDNFVDQHRSNNIIAICGKIAITKCILDAEATSLMRVDSSNIYNKLKFSNLESTWFNSFFQLLTQNCQMEDLSSHFSKIAIVCFNYDRCIEHYLHQSLQNHYGVSAELATSILSHLEIHHPYGTVGSLPWQAEQTRADFGATPSPDELIKLANGIRTFTEGTDSKTSDIDAIRKALNNSDRIVFLGFAFDPLNLELLFGSDIKSQPIPSCTIYSTALGFSPSNVDEVKNDLCHIGRFDRTRMQIRNDLTCGQLFVEYWRSLSLARSVR